jgi:post-segregation antitoxin (ccd killing protein)
MHRTQVYIEDDIFAKTKTIAQSLNISISQFIRDAISNQLKTKETKDMKSFLENMTPIKSFEDIDATDYVQSIRSKSRIICE